MAKDRKPTDPSDWAVEHTSMESDGGSRWVRGAPKVHHTLGAYLMAPESDPSTQAEMTSRRGVRPANLDISANWVSQGPGEFVRPNIGPEHTPEQWEYQGRLPNSKPDEGHIHQGLLFQRPEITEPAKIDWMRSTKADRGRIGTGLGILQNEADRRGIGELSEGEADYDSGPNLSPHSAALTAKLTGRSHKPINNMDFIEEGSEDRRNLEVPREGEGGSFFKPKTEFGDTQEMKVLSRGEANMGLARFRVALSQTPAGQERAEKRAARKRSSEPTYTQDSLFPEPEGPSAGLSQRRHDYQTRYGVPLHGDVHY